MRVPSIVLLTLNNPREKHWGELIALTEAGVTLRSVELNSLEDFLTQILEHEGPPIPFPTTFFPMHRVERISLDEQIGEVPTVGERFRARMRMTVVQYLDLLDEKTSA
jgi:hypothetical protein